MRGSDQPGSKSSIIQQEAIFTDAFVSQQGECRAIVISMTAIVPVLLQDVYLIKNKRKTQPQAGPYRRQEGSTCNPTVEDGATLILRSSHSTVYTRRTSTYREANHYHTWQPSKKAADNVHCSRPDLR